MLITFTMLMLFLFLYLANKWVSQWALWAHLQQRTTLVNLVLLVLLSLFVSVLFSRLKNWRHTRDNPNIAFSRWNDSHPLVYWFVSSFLCFFAVTCLMERPKFNNFNDVNWFHRWLFNIRAIWISFENELLASSSVVIWNIYMLHKMDDWASWLGFCFCMLITIMMLLLFL